jgi:pyruvate dehydrogenase E2 component (dihydrolipoamide acetyltransferase)
MMGAENVVEIRADEFDDSGCEPMMLFWYVEVGDEVTEGQELCEVETAKAVFVIEAPTAGTLIEICVPETDAVDSGQLLGRIRGD